MVKHAYNNFDIMTALKIENALDQKIKDNSALDDNKKNPSRILDMTMLWSIDLCD